MFTIHKLFGVSDVRKLLKSFRGGIVIGLLLYVPTLFGQLAECGFEENGYLFMHPYFIGTNWNATNWISNILPAEEMCAEKPVYAAAGGLASQGTFLFTASDGAWMMTNGPLEDNDCPCCKPRIMFEPPFAVTVPAVLALQPSLPFHLLRRGAADKDTVYLAAVASGNRIYCLHISTRTGKTGAVDTLSISGTGTATINGVWGEPGGSGNDTALWVGGSSGFLQLVPFSTNQWGTARSINLDNTETVTAVGSGYLGTLSGKLFKRSGDAFTAVGVQGASAIRRVNGSVAVGDGGTVIVNRGGAWQAKSSGTTNYRLGNLTANANGAVVELIDATWKYSLLQLTDSATSISSVSPSSAASGLNQGLFVDSLDGILSLSVRLWDIDNNRVFPAVSLKRGSTITKLDKADDSTALLGHNPSAICDTNLAYFNDSLITLALNLEVLTMETRALRSKYNASCTFWDWEQFNFKRTQSWKQFDTLIVAAGKDTLRILHNKHNATVAGLPRSIGAHGDWRVRFGYEGGKVRLVQSGLLSVRRVVLVDASGRCLWQRTLSAASNEVLLSPDIPRGIHFLRIDYADGTSEVRRIALVSR